EVLAQSTPMNRFTFFIGGVNRDVHGYDTAVPWGYGVGASLAHESKPFAIVWTINATHFAAKSIVVPALSASAERLPPETSARENVDDWRQLEINQGQGELTILSAAVGPQFSFADAKQSPHFGARAGITYLGILGQHYFRPSLEGSAGYSVNV